MLSQSYSHQADCFYLTCASALLLGKALQICPCVCPLKYIPDVSDIVHTSCPRLVFHFLTVVYLSQDLEHREKQYDGREHLDVYTSDNDTEPALRNVLTFVATSKSVNWLGPASVEAVAQQIAAATGPSGPNYEYLERLAEALWKVKPLCPLSCTHPLQQLLIGLPSLQFCCWHGLYAAHISSQ